MFVLLSILMMMRVHHFSLLSIKKFFQPYFYLYSLLWFSHQSIKFILLLSFFCLQSHRKTCLNNIFTFGHLSSKCSRFSRVDYCSEVNLQFLLRWWWCNRLMSWHWWEERKWFSMESFSNRFDVDFTCFSHLILQLNDLILISTFIK